MRRSTAAYRTALEPATSGTSSATATSSCRASERPDDRERPTETPTLPAGRRAVLYAVAPARRGDRRTGGRATRHDGERRAPAPRPRWPTTGSSKPPSRADRARARATRARVLGDGRGRRLLPQGLRRAHQRAARLRERHRPRTARRALRQAPGAPHRERAGTARAGSDPRRQGGRAHPDPRRGRLPRHATRRSRPACYRVDRAQLRDLGGRPALRPGVHQRARLHPRRRCPTRRVERVQHMVAGARHCAYEIRARAAA